MNGRVAKALRKIAALNTVGKPARCAQYIQSCDASKPVEWKTNSAGQWVAKSLIWRGYGFMNKGTTRGYYRLLKRHYYGRIPVAA